MNRYCAMTTFLSLLTTLLLLFSPVQTDVTTTIPNGSDGDVTTFIVVRHAEKVDSSTDPDLSKAGFERADRLAAVLQYMQIDGLHSTPFKRTRQTLGTLSEKHGLTVHEYDPRNPNSVLDALKANYGKTYVIAGHSNTAPNIVNYLTGNNDYADLEDHVYDHLWIVHCFANGTTKSVLLHY